MEAMLAEILPAVAGTILGVWLFRRMKRWRS